MSKTFRFVGISKDKGQFKVRYTNDGVSRLNHLVKNVGHTDVVFMDLEESESKEDAVDALLKQEWVTGNPEVLEAVKAEAARLGFTV